MIGRVEVSDRELADVAAAGEPEMIDLLLFAAGKSVRWDRLVERATGTPFSVDALARAVAHD